MDELPGAVPMSNRTQLYLMTPRLDAAAWPALEAALGAGGVDCVLLRWASGAGGRSEVADAVRLVQGAGAAALLEGEGRDAARAGADGVHVAGPALTEALRALKPDGIVGAGGLATRDDCMVAGELGADYLLFGEPKPDGFTPPLGLTVERTQWWAEIFEVPCVAYAAALDHVRPLVEAGADFVALGDALWADPRGPAAVLAALRGQLAREPAA